jgi:hypothetical protein
MKATAKRSRKNPALTREAATLRFRELLRQRGAESMAVAQDLLEESGLTLEEMGEAGLGRIPHTMSNEIAIMRPDRAEYVSEGYFELDPEDLAHPMHAGVAWTISDRGASNVEEAGMRYVPRLFLVFGPMYWTEGQYRPTAPLRIDNAYVERSYDLDVENIVSRRGHIYIADLAPVIVRQAWQAAIALKIVLGNRESFDDIKWVDIRVDIAQLILDTRYRGAIGGIVPWPDEEIVSKPRATLTTVRTRRNPAPTDDAAFVKSVQELLYERDPESSSIVQDMLIDHGWTLADFGTSPLKSSRREDAHRDAQAALARERARRRRCVRGDQERRRGLDRRVPVADVLGELPHQRRRLGTERGRRTPN